MSQFPKYRRDLIENNFEVTPNQRATHMHILERAIPVKKSLEELLGQLRRHDALDADEAAHIQETIDLIGGLLYPVALLNTVADERETAKMSMFTRHLASRGTAHDNHVMPEDEDDEPSFRP